MMRGSGAERYHVRLSVPRRGGIRAWGLAGGEFERSLTARVSATVGRPRVESETRRGRDYVRVRVAMEVMAEDVGQALVTAWWVFRQAAGDDIVSWDTGAASAEVQPVSRD